MTVDQAVKVRELRAEYQEIARQVSRLCSAPGGVDARDADLLSLQAREVRIVDQVRALGLAPDVLIEAVP